MLTGRYIVVPRSGIRADAAARSALLAIHEATFAPPGAPRTGRVAAFGNAPMTVIDSANEDGAKLVEASPETADAVNSQPGPVRMEPEVIYSLPRRRVAPLASGPLATTQTITVTCVHSVTGAPIPGLDVIAITNVAQNIGAVATTDATGAARLVLGGPVIEQLLVLPKAGFWGAVRLNQPLTSTTLRIDPVTPQTIDVIRATYPTRGFVAGAGVKVGVLDTGCGPHAELNVIGGRCTVTGQPANSFLDIDEHGTHVAGLIGGRGATGPAFRGLAPGVDIHAYRVFEFGPNGKLGASNYAILKAMILAAADGCDILNLSLGGGEFDAIVEEAIRDAGEQGILSVIAAGNDGRQPVSFPAAYNGAFAVSAMGDERHIPVGAFDRISVARPPVSSSSGSEFLADFSNVGPQISVVGLGVGVTSTLPNGKLGVMSGTSMAAPMIAGAAAAMLSMNSGILGQARNAARAIAMSNMVKLNCVRRFGHPRFEGFGLPSPGSV